MFKQNLWYKKIPTLITIGNSICGFFAILYTLTAYEKVVRGFDSFNSISISSHDVVSVFSFSAGLILLAMIFDACDGLLARKMNAVSSHGMQMDSLCDMVTFGVAPAVIVAVHSHIQAFIKSPLGDFASYPWLWLACSIYIGCAALRLAFHNVMSMDEEAKKISYHQNFFSGLPTPAAAAAICSIFFMNQLMYKKLNPDTLNWIMGVFLPFYMAFIGFMMNSRIPYIHIGKWILSKDTKVYYFALLSVILLYINPYSTPTILVSIYIISGPIGLLLKVTKQYDKG